MSMSSDIDAAVLSEHCVPKTSFSIKVFFNTIMSDFSSSVHSLASLSLMSRSCWMARWRACSLDGVSEPLVQPSSPDERVSVVVSSSSSVSGTTVLVEGIEEEGAFVGDCLGTVTNVIWLSCCCTCSLASCFSKSCNFVPALRITPIMPCIVDNSSSLALRCARQAIVRTAGIPLFEGDRMSVLRPRGFDPIERIMDDVFSKPMAEQIIRKAFSVCC